MAGVQISSAHALAQRAYRARLTLETQLNSIFLQLSGAEESNIGVEQESPGTNRGTTINHRFQAWNPAPLPVGNLKLGYGTTDTWYETTLDINYLGLAMRELPNEVEDQNRVDFSLKDSAQVGMAKDCAQILESSIIHQLAGFTPVNASAYTIDGRAYSMSGMNAVTAPTASHHFLCPDASGDNATEAAVAADPTAVMTSRLYDKILTRIRSRDWVRWPMAPATTPWGKYYLSIGNGEYLQQIKENSSESDIYDLSRAQIEGGAAAMGITTLTNQGFIYKDTVFLESDHMPPGCSGETPGATTAGTAIANVKRAVVLGAGAFDIRWGEGFTGGNHIGYVDDKTLRQFSMGADTVYGAKKRLVNGEEWGCVVISHYSAHTGTYRYA